ncbi:MAG: tetratricopeptide repeat protein, partial [Thermoplasmata archaeon]
KGTALYNLERYEEALECYDKAIELKPDSEEAWNNKGNTLRKLGKNKEAIDCYDAVLRINPDNAEAQASNRARVSDKKKKR